MMRVFYYAVARGRTVGVFSTWEECRRSVEGYSGAVYKKFPTNGQARAFVEQNGKRSIAANPIRKTKEAKRPVEVSLQASSGNLHTPAEIFTNDDTLPSHTSSGGEVVVYTDGACTENGSKRAKAGYGVFWSDGNPDNVSAPVIGPATNNRAEYMAVIAALEKAERRNFTRLVIRTDSNLLLKSMTEWIFKWKQNGWKTTNGDDVKNRDLLERIHSLSSRLTVRYEKVAGHSGDYGNDQADLLARQGAETYTK